jgi:hypothetical protein
MTTIQKTFFIALVAQVGYWLLAALAFGPGQLLLHNAAAIMIGLFVAHWLYKHGYITAWATPFAWVVASLAAFQILLTQIRLINWPLIGAIPTDAWNLVRFLDMVFISIITAYGVVMWQKWRLRTKKFVITFTALVSC